MISKPNYLGSGWAVGKKKERQSPSVYEPGSMINATENILQFVHKALLHHLLFKQTFLWRLYAEGKQLKKFMLFQLTTSIS